VKLPEVTVNTDCILLAVRANIEWRNSWRLKHYPAAAIGLYFNLFSCLPGFKTDTSTSCDLERMASRKTSRRSTIEPHKGDKRYVRRNPKGELKKEVSVGRSLAVDKRKQAKNEVPKGPGARGDTT
jgi:hypothetical protein